MDWVNEGDNGKWWKKEVRDKEERNGQKVQYHARQED